MRLLITGGQGQLGRSLQAALARRPHLKPVVWDVADHDISKPAAAQWVADLCPDVVINAAAWTNVDAAEANPDAAYAANALAPKYLAEGCARCGAALLQVSTNEVFAGEPGVFYREYDATNGGGSTYARSKLAAESAVKQLLSRLYVVRIAWLFGPGGKNFPTKIVAAADRNGRLRVVDDEFGNPTYAPDVAEAMLQLVESERFGIYHLVNDGWCSRYDLARTVLQASSRSHVPIAAIKSTDWARPTTPPPHAVLVNQAGAALGIHLRPWQEAVAEYCRCELAPVVDQTEILE
jgi:dTDP-4-dehydrorhamnose reductase